MALSQDTRSAVSFKKLLGVTNTKNSNAFYNESIPSQIQADSTELFGEVIDEDPSQATSAGVVQRVDLELGSTPNGGETGFSYELLIPAGTTLNFKSGSVTVQAGDDRTVRNWTQIIPAKYSKVVTSGFDEVTDDGYKPEVYKDTPLNLSNKITQTQEVSGNPVNWRVDPVAGVLVAEEKIQDLFTAGEGNVVVPVYLYIGRYIKGVIDNIGTGATGGSGNTIVEGAGIDTEVDDSAGTITLYSNLDEVLTPSTGLVKESFNANTYEYELGVDTTYLDNNYVNEGGDIVSGVYNFNNSSLVIDNSEGLDGGSASNGVLKSQADNFNINNSGTITVFGNLDATRASYGEITCNSLTELSSKRYKTGIQSTTGHLEKIGQLRPVSFENEQTGEEEYGLLAEEVAEVYPEFVKYDEEGPASINYSKMVTVLVDAVKDLKEKLD